jgi:hypothetical protein
MSVTTGDSRPLVTPAELGLVLDLASKAPATIGQGFALHEVLSRLVALANAKGHIGVIAEQDVESVIPLTP